MEKELASVYYDPSHPAGYAGAKPLLKTMRNKYSQKVISDWLKSQDTYTLHKPVRKVFPRNKFVVYEIHELWQADLNDMRGLSKFNSGENYILTVIDVLSKKAFARTLTRKTSTYVIKAFKSIFNESKTKPRCVQTDKGSEFISKEVRNMFKKNNIKFFTTNNPDVKAAVVERFNRTLKTRMWRYLTHNNTYRYIDVLQQFVTAYNNSNHRSIKMRPVDVNDSNRLTVWMNLYGKSVQRRQPKLKSGDSVRITKAKGTFEKGYETNWSEEIFTVKDILPYNIPLYKLVDSSGETIQGTFYEHELQQVLVEQNKLYKIDKILATKGKGVSKQYLVKWRGWPTQSWIRASDLQQI